MRSVTRTVAVGLATVLCGTLSGWRSSSSALSGTSTSKPPTTSKPSQAAAKTPSFVVPVDRAVGDAITFVQTARGLRFKVAPKVTVLASPAFVKRADQARKSDPDYEQSRIEFAALLRSFGFISGAGESEKLIDALFAAGLGGFYDPQTKELVVRSGAMGPSGRATLVHELVHALEDQYFDLDRPELGKLHGDEESGFQFLVEGSARYFENKFRATFTPAERKAADDEEQAMVSDGPLLSLFADPDYVGALPFLLQLLMAPYEQGKGFVEALVRDGGTKALDAAYQRPPVSTEQAVDLGAYKRADAPVAVARPPIPAGAKIVDWGTVGAAGFDAIVATPELIGDASVMSEAARGWGGDRYVIWSTPSRICVRVDAVMDTQRDATELRAAFAALSKRLSVVEAKLEPRALGFRYTSCALPGR